MMDDYTDEQIDRMKSLMEKIKTITFGSSNAEDPNIRFSKYDNCHTEVTKYVDGSEETIKNFDRELSKIFGWAFDVLEEWGYGADAEAPFGGLDVGYEFKTNLEGLPKVSIQSNILHHSYKINYGQSFPVNCKEDIQVPLIQYIIDSIRDSGNIRLIRDYNLKRIGL